MAGKNGANAGAAEKVKGDAAKKTEGDLVKLLITKPRLKQKQPGFFRYATYCVAWHVFLLY